MTQSYGIYLILNQNKDSGFALNIKVIKSYFNFFIYVEKHVNVIIQYHVLSYKVSHEQRKISTDNRYFMSKINDWHVIILYLKFSFVLILFQFQFQFYN